MILRVLRARVIEGQEPSLVRFIRDEAMAQALAIPGLLSFQPALRRTPAGTELVVVSTWTGFDDLLASGRVLSGSVLLGTTDMLGESQSEHFELVIGEARAMPLREGKLRLTRIPIRPNAESAYYAAVRQWADRLLDEAGLVAFSLGRRVVGHQDEIVAAMIWQDEAALRDAAGSDLERPMGERELAEFWAAEPAIEHFDALTAVDPHPDAPAILLADDERRYVHATPAAASLTGRSLARLLTLRVEDIAPEAQREAVVPAWEQFLEHGSMVGPFVLERPDGSSVEVLFAAKANAPWPGTHASLLAPLGDAAELDIDRALVDAGLVARYVPGPD